MSNLDERPDLAVLAPAEPRLAVEVLEPRLVPLGGPRAMTVYRTLPQRRRSLVGAWCFLDHYGPDDVAATGGMRVPRHPHTGLATVSWLFTGRIDHLDSAGNAASVRPGELNLMIAGQGITHSEISTGDTRVLHGVQLWYALPDATRFSRNHFEHYVPEPVTAPGVTARVFLGGLLGSTSPVPTRAPDLLGAELLLDRDATVALGVRPDFEHAVLAETGTVGVNADDVEHRCLAYVPPGSDTLTLAAGPTGARVLLLGGVPLDEQIVMWWNFVGRSHEEIVEFRRRYQAELGFEPGDAADAGRPPLFGRFPPDQPAALPAPTLPTTRLRPRRQPGTAENPPSTRRTTMTDQRFEVQHRPDESRYVLVDHEAATPEDQVIGEESYVDVDTGNGVQRVLFHTGVSDDYRGQGLASPLVRGAVDDVIARGYAVVPVCPYVAGWLPKHPEYDDHVVKPRPEHLQAVSSRQR